MAVGEGALVAAGSVITEDVPAGALALGRARQATKEGRADATRGKLRDAEARRGSGGGAALMRCLVVGAGALVAAGSGHHRGRARGRARAGARAAD